MGRTVSYIALAAGLALLSACASKPQTGHGGMTVEQALTAVDSLGRCYGIGRIWANEDSLKERPYTDAGQIERDVRRLAGNRRDRTVRVRSTDRLVDMALWDSVATRSSREGNIHWQARMNDSLSLNVAVSYVCEGETEMERVVRLDGAYVTRRGFIERTPVTCERMRCMFDESSPFAFVFSTTFVYGGVRYSVHGRFEDGPYDESRSVMRCTPLRLSDETLQEGEYQRNGR